MKGETGRKEEMDAKGNDEEKDRRRLGKMLQVNTLSIRVFKKEIPTLFVRGREILGTRTFQTTTSRVHQRD